MNGKRKKSNTVRNSVIVAVLIVVLVIAFASVYNSTQAPKIDSEKYFEISGAAYFGTTTDNGSIIKIFTVGFNLRPVLGDAHSVNVQCLNAYQPEYYQTIPKGESVSVEIQLYPQLMVPAVSEFPIDIDIQSAEASGTIPIMLHQNG